MNDLHNCMHALQDTQKPGNHVTCNLVRKVV